MIIAPWFPACPGGSLTRMETGPAGASLSWPEPKERPHRGLVGLPDHPNPGLEGIGIVTEADLEPLRESPQCTMTTGILPRIQQRGHR